MGSVVMILEGPPEGRRLEGMAEIVEVIEYKGHGLYSVWCIFLDDPEGNRVVREYDIDEKPPPPLLDSLTVEDFQRKPTQKVGDAK